ncbi:Uncharacterized protein MJ0128 [Geodia barretti]|uniref:Uncharacterized protein MJ0128 n=1 Tax=Geodia barretti TaxID=519541 RepID=A0AA35RE47_GEOBA|nr:Uncharacterized protein MJ0128 [Geodia barretti]
MAKTALTRDEALLQLRKHKPELVEKFGLSSLALFGAVVRDEAEEDSSIDILVGFEGEVDWKRYFGVQFYIEDMMGHQVVLVTEQALRKELRPYIDAESVYV